MDYHQNLLMKVLMGVLVVKVRVRTISLTFILDLYTFCTMCVASMNFPCLIFVN